MRLTSISSIVVFLTIGVFETNRVRFVLGSTKDTKDDVLKIVKCCEPDEIRSDDTCVPFKETNETSPWRPEFVDEKSSKILAKPSSNQPEYEFKIGQPRCRSNERQWFVYHNPKGPDLLTILSTGELRHNVCNFKGEISQGKDTYGSPHQDFDYDEDVDDHCMHHDYQFGQYCIDKVILSRDRLATTYAVVCVPEVVARWTDVDYLMRHVIDPTFHAIAIAAYLVVAVVYFVLPQLRDLVGNIVTSMTLCLIASQCASTVTIFTEMGSHVSFLIADTVAYVSSLAAFFWLNAFGYYVWNAFRSRNVFLRVTDGKKYCYYSTYVWGSTISIATTAIFAHFALETNKSTVGNSVYSQEETIGWLGTSVLFTSVAFTIIVDLCFVLTTANRIKRMSTYGRIHHKMKYSFRMYVLLFGIMSIGWLFLILSRLRYDFLVYINIVVNLLQALLVLYVCVFGQRRVTFLLGKTCNCCNNGENIEGLDWGEEMTAINAGY